MNTTGIHQFELSDANGTMHAYIVQEHPAGEGMAVLYELLGLGAPAVLHLAGAALKSTELVGAVVATVRGEQLELGAADLGQLLADLDLAAVGAELQRALATGRAPELTKRIMSHVTRDGQRMSGPGFERAYQANYGEMLQAVWRVCTINRFFPLPGTSPGNSSPQTPPLGG